MTPDAAHHFFLLAVLTLATILAITAMRTFAYARQGRRAGVSQAGGTVALEALRDDIGEMKNRLASVETLLRDVS